MPPTLSKGDALPGQLPRILASIAQQPSKQALKLRIFHNPTPQRGNVDIDIDSLRRRVMKILVRRPKSPLQNKQNRGEQRSLPCAQANWPRVKQPSVWYAKCLDVVGHPSLREA